MAQPAAAGGDDEPQRDAARAADALAALGPQPVRGGRDGRRGLADRAMSVPAHDVLRENTRRKQPLIRESLGLTVGAVIVIIGVTIGAIASGVLGNEVRYAFLGRWMNLETQANRQSYQYVETKTNLLLKLAQDYEHLDATPEQKAAILNRMRIERALIPADQVPGSVNAFLSRNR